MPHQKRGFAAGRLERIAEHLTRSYIEPGKIAGCQTLISRGGEVAYFSSLGQADRERAVPMRDDTLFRIYSMTKPVTSVALMTLYERGLFQLGDAVHRYIPEWRDQRVWASGEGANIQTVALERPVTFRDLLSHTGGLTYGGGLPGIGAEHPVDTIYQELRIDSFRGEGNLDTMVRRLGQVPLICQPGKHFMYSLSTDVCAALVEILSGKRFDQYLQEQIFAPLGMHDTGFFVPPEKRARLAANYRRQPDSTPQLIDDPERSPFLKEPTLFSGGGGLVSTTADYHKFCDMLRRGGERDGQRILGPRTIALMHENHLPGKKTLDQLAIGLYAETPLPGIGFGLGFAVTEDAIAAGSFGEGAYFWGGAASTIFWIDPKEDLIAIFMTQLMPSRSYDFRGQLRNIVYSALE
jgi:CubicO group peptidase (beta-lactamase class C family)